jgi:hypothetical protein
VIENAQIIRREQLAREEAIKADRAMQDKSFK